MSKLEDKYSKEELRELCLNSLYFFGRAILNWNWFEPHVHGSVCELLEDENEKRLQFTLPRGFLKTTLITITYSIWRALPPREKYKKREIKDPLHDPNVRILIVQNSRTNARKRVNVIRQHLQHNNLLQKLFPEIIPDTFHGDRRWSDSHAEIQREEKHPEATWEAAGIGTSLVSRHYSEIIEDDLIAPKKDDMTGTEAMPTREEVEKAIGFHKSAISLLANQETGRVINVGTRWCKYDVIQYIKNEQVPPYKVFEMSALDENNEPTYPERFSKSVLENIKQEQGTYIYSSQYLNQPYDSEKMVFKPEWIKRYNQPPPLEEMKRYISIDPAIGQKKENDFSIVLAAGITSKRELLTLEYERERYNPSELIEKIFEYFERYNPEAVIIETVAYQQALAHFVEKEAMDRFMYLPIIEYSPSKSKETRIKGLQPIAQRGKLLIRPFHRELAKELRDFPYSEHDDISDALAQCKIHANFPASPREKNQKTNQLLEDIKKEIRNRNRGVGNLPFKDPTEEKVIV